MVHANYQGRLNYGKYQFSFLRNIKYSDEYIGFLIPQSGHIRKIILRTPYDFDKTPGLYRFDDYVEITQSFLTIVKKKKKKKITTGEEIEVKRYNCNLHYEKIPGREINTVKDEIARVIVYDYDDYDIVKNTSISEGDTINIRTDLDDPNVYEFSKDDDIYLVTFLIELDPL